MYGIAGHAFPGPYRLAENSRTAIQAAIKRASKSARTNLHQLDRELLVQLEQVYRNAVTDLRAYLQLRAGDDNTLRLETMRSLLDQAESRLSLLEAERNGLLDDGLRQAAGFGVQPFTHSVEIGSSLVSIADDAVRTVTQFVAEDGLQLSDRLWAIDNHAREVVRSEIQRAVVQGHSASQAARDLLARGLNVPPELARKMSAAQWDKIARQIDSGLFTGEGSAYSNARRVMRTEINRAHGEAYQAAAFDHPDVIGTRFLLSPNHPRVDICDMHARVNRYGLGPGVYPEGKNPWPAHPNTLSFTEVVFSDEVSDEDKKGKENRIDWLNQQPHNVQEGVLGSRRKRAALERGYLRESQINTPWRVLKMRYARKGVDVDSLKPTPTAPEPSFQPGLQKPANLLPFGSPVSDAFDVQAYKAQSASVLHAIDAIHGDGALPKIPIKRSSSKGYAGAYRFNLNGQAIDIKLSGKSTADFSLVHEIGHFLDHQGAPGSGFSSLNRTEFSAWRDVVQDTQAVRELKALRNGPDIISVGEGSHLVRKGYLDYLMDVRELWARSYSQYIARKSGDKAINDQLDTELTGIDQAKVKYRAQWMDDDFAKLAEAVEEVLMKLGWMK
jgi:hypothetical protein